MSVRKMPHHLGPCPPRSHFCLLLSAFCPLPFAYIIARHEHRDAAKGRCDDRRLQGTARRRGRRRAPAPPGRTDPRRGPPQDPAQPPPLELHHHQRPPPPRATPHTLHPPPHPPP